ncbi:MAG: malto-oligosyltrehalose trehalohydrolase [Pirellulales bacterium]
MATVALQSKEAQRTFQRRLPIGAEAQPDGGVHFRVYAPLRRHVRVVFEDSQDADSEQEFELHRDEQGYHTGFAPAARPGMKYRLELDELDGLFADPASRFQPEGCQGPSEIVDPAAFEWQDAEWHGVSMPGQTLYELHVGTFTPEGTWQGAAKKLPHLVELGVTVVEVMPVAEFPGRFGWGYDGVFLFAPTRLYGAPDDFKRFVNEAHRLRLGVILDVVYNHFGPADNYLHLFADNFRSNRHMTEWGEAINFDGEDAAPIREFFIANAGYWIDEFHLDGLRLDAVQAIIDDSPDHITAALTRQARKMAGDRQVIITAENELQQSRMLRSPNEGGFGLDGGWNDDFHHAARVAMTGQNDAYYADYQGTPQEMISAIKWGYLYQGQWNARQKKFRGQPTWGIPAHSFVVFLQNHDQVANSLNGRGMQHYTSPGRYRAMTTLLLLAPGTPLLFMGQEFASSKPFLYFADHEEDLAKLIREGRVASFHQFRCLRSPEMKLFFADPGAIETFEACKLDWSERETNAQAYRLHRDLIRLRQEDPVFSAQEAANIHGMVLAPEAFALRYAGLHSDDRLVIVNLGRDLFWTTSAYPLLAPPYGADWKLMFSTGDPKYGGPGVAAVDMREWHLPGHAALVLRPEPKVLEPHEALTGWPTRLDEPPECATGET